MTSVKQPLPDFTSPPVGEVVLSVQFARISSLQAAHLGLLWERYRAEFPRTETHPPLPTVKDFSKPALAEAAVRFELRQPQTVPRVWFLNSPGTELIQIQADRFVCNWRRVVPSDVYPRYPYVRDRFLRN